MDHNKTGLQELDFSFAFQPIVDWRTRTVYSHEALLRGLNNESACQVIHQSSRGQIQAFDAVCRAKAIEVAARIGMHTPLSLNLFPGAALNVGVSLNSTIEAAHRHLFPLDQIIVEATEIEAVGDCARFAQIVKEFRRAGMKFAIDDFGDFCSGLGLLSELQPDIVKLGMSLVRDIHSHRPRQVIVRAIAQVCIDLGIEIVVEGVETVDELSWFNDLGVHLYQGYLFAKPMFEAMPFHGADPN